MKAALITIILVSIAIVSTQGRNEYRGRGGYRGGYERSLTDTFNQEGEADQDNTGRSSRTFNQEEVDQDNTSRSSRNSRFNKEEVDQDNTSRDARRFLFNQAGEARRGRIEAPEMINGEQGRRKSRRNGEGKRQGGRIEAPEMMNEEGLGYDIPTDKGIYPMLYPKYGF